MTLLGNFWSFSVKWASCGIRMRNLFSFDDMSHYIQMTFLDNFYTAFYGNSTVHASFRLKNDLICG